MSSQQIVDADGPSLKQQIQSCDLLLVDFWATWCAPCRAMSPMLDRLASDFPNLKIAKVDADANADLLKEYDVKSLPTLLVYRSGTRVEQLVGKVPYALMVRAVQGPV